MTLRRRTRTFLLAALTLALTIFALSTVALADRQSSCESVRFVYELQSDGSALVTEEWTFAYSGDPFSRFYRVLPYSGGMGIRDIAAFDGNGVPYQRLNALDDNRPQGRYAVEASQSEYRIEVYHLTENGSRTFILTYAIDNLVLLNEDVAELNHMLIDETAQFGDIAVAEAIITLPEGASTEELYLWGHTPVQGAVAIDSATRVSYYGENLPNGSYIELHLLAPLSLFPYGVNYSGESRFEEVKRMESALIGADNSNDDSGNYTSRGNNSGAYIPPYGPLTPLGSPIALAVVVAVGILATILRTRMMANHKRRYRVRPAQEPEYCRYLPSDLSPAEVIALLKRCDATYSPDRSCRYAATLMDLNLKGYLHFFDAGESNVGISIADKLSAVGLEGHEKTLLKLVQTAANAQNDPFTMNDLSAFIEAHPSAAQDNLTSFDRQAEANVEVKGYVGLAEATPLQKRLQSMPFMLARLIVLIAGIALLAVGAVLSMSSGIETLHPLVSVAAILLFARVYMGIGVKRALDLTQKGMDEAALWMAFYRYLNDFTRVDESDLPDLKVWERYLVYAAAMGISGQIADKLYIHYPCMERDFWLYDHYMYYLYSPRYAHSRQGAQQAFFGSLAAFERSTAAAAAYRDPSSDSNLGGGGGSTSGGSSGGSSGGGGGND